jgi:CRP/FNR family cyclic AMP-dependent transcriptional regulator
MPPSLPPGPGYRVKPSGRPGVHVQLTHEQLAAPAGTSRETTTKVLGEFADQGLISLGRGRITILDTDSPHALAGGD